MITFIDFYSLYIYFSFIFFSAFIQPTWFPRQTGLIKKKEKKKARMSDWGPPCGSWGPMQPHTALFVDNTAWLQIKVKKLSQISPSLGNSRSSILDKNLNKIVVLALMILICKLV